MSEKRPAILRLLVVALVVSNAALLLYIVLTPDASSNIASRIEALQINPGRIKVLGAANRGPAAPAPAAKPDRGGAQRACLEWGPFSPSEISKVEVALSRLALPQPARQRAIEDSSRGRRYAYLLREPDANLVAQIAELQRGFPGTEIKAAACPG